jgi:small subunit ribosomal protein S4
MNQFKPRNKKCFLVNENIWSDKKFLKLKKKKWKYLLNKTNNLKTNLIKNNFEKPKSRKHLYKKRLYSKQLFKSFYGCINEYKLKNLFEYSLKQNKKNIIENFIILLESKIDIVLVRLNIVKNVFQARQLITHGNVKINGIKILSTNFFLKEGSIIFINNFYKNDINSLNYIEYNQKLNVFIFLKKPLFKDINYPFFLNTQLVLEYLKNY